MIDNLDIKKLESIYKEIGLSLIEPLKIHAESYIKIKIAKYQNENDCFEKKYKISFKEFKEKIDGSENIENFDMEDDIMDWEFAIKNLEYWHGQLKQIA